MEHISSTANPKIKRLCELQAKSKARKDEGVMVVEGERELSRAIAAGCEVETVFLCPEICGNYNGRVDFTVSPAVYEKIAYRGSTEGVIAILKSTEKQLKDLELPAAPLVVVVESVEKPGNLGAILRTCDAAGADALIVCDPLTDLHNPNLLRSSLGAAFTVPTVACTSQEAIAWLKANGIKIYTAQLQDSAVYYNADFKGPSAIVMGTESTGLTDVWREAADAHILIPMLGTVDSLNVSVSSAILIYEAVRQRNL
ncbi:MAG: RNA methyltransferase [Bacteroidales bacterium]|nr:RNA methyltransferase [Bacteroidales bacterium]